MGRVLIICCYIVGRYPGYGVLPFDRLVLLGYYPRGLSIYWQLGEIGLESILRIFGLGATLCDVDYLEGEK